MDCRHANNKDEITMSISKIKLLVNIGVCLFLTGCCIYYCYKIHGFIEENDILMGAMFLTNLFCCTRTFSLILFYTTRIRYIFRIFEKFKMLAKFWKISKSEALLSKAAILTLRSNLFMLIFVNCVCIIGYLIYVIAHYSDLPFILNITSCLCLSIDSIFLTYFEYLKTMYKLLSETYLGNLKSELQSSLNKTNAKKCIVYKDNVGIFINKSIGPALLLTKDTHSAAMKIIKDINKLVELAVVSCLIFTMIIFILSAFFIWASYFDEHFVYFMPYIFAQLFQLGIYSLFIVYILTEMEKLSLMSQDALSLLFKYPISKLSRVEAEQMETLIKTLKLQKPIIRSSDIFTVGIRLMASIIGTIVTYVLVALQFHDSWIKQKNIVETEYN